MLRVCVMMFGVKILRVLFCKQKATYEVRISDWSSDVCSSELWTRGGVRYRDRNLRESFSQPSLDGAGFGQCQRPRRRPRFGFAGTTVGGVRRGCRVGYPRRGGQSPLGLSKLTGPTFSERDASQRPHLLSSHTPPPCARRLSAPF